MSPLDPDKKQDATEKPPAWLISMGDVTALMLTFFVMLFSMSYVKSEKWDEVTSLLNRKLQPTDLTKPSPVSEMNIPTVQVLPGLSTDYLHRILSEKLSDDPVLSRAVLTPLEGTMVISLPSDAMFESGKDALSEEAVRAISDLAAVLTLVGNQIEVVGHADPLPPGDGVYQNNWELSLARALKVANILTEAGYTGRFAAVGRGDSRFRHLDPRIPEERRYAMSRRVDVVLYSVAGGQ